MNSTLTAFVALVCTSGVFNLYLCLYVFMNRHRYMRIAHLFILYTLTISIYCLAAAFGLMAMTLEGVKFWTLIQYIGLAFAPLLGLLFIMQYVGIHLRKKIYLLLLVIPCITLVMVATNDMHHLFYRVLEIDPVRGAPYVYQEIGIWYMVNGIFIFSCMFVAFLLALSRWKETAKPYRPHLIALMISQLVPMLTAFLYLIGFTPAGVDPVPMVLWISSLLFLWSIHSSGMFTLMPIAKDTIFQSINDGVMVLDDTRRMIEFNQACKRMFPLLNQSMYGTDFNKVWLLIAGSSFPFTAEDHNTQEIEVESDHVKRVYKVSSSPIKQANSKQGLLMIFTDITELKSLQEKLEHSAYYDELTQIYNRRAFFQNCEQELVEAKKAKIPYTLVMMDIDHFKSVNDTYGHYVGDQLLKHVVHILQRQMKGGSIIARLGGEEFVLAMNGATLQEGEQLANQLRQQLEEQPLVTEEAVVSVTLSSGVAEASNEEEETLYQLMNRADIALYQAKREGRNQVHVYGDVEM